MRWWRATSSTRSRCRATWGGRSPRRSWRCLVRGAGSRCLVSVWRHSVHTERDMLGSRWNGIEEDGCRAGVLQDVKPLPTLVAVPCCAGRESGAEEWRAARGETGTACAEGCRPPAAGPAVDPGTRYRLAKDEHLQGQLVQGGLRRVCGGAVRASGENPPGETAVQASGPWGRGALCICRLAGLLSPA